MADENLITSSGALASDPLRRLHAAATGALRQLCDTSTRGLREADELRAALREAESAIGVAPTAPADHTALLREAANRLIEIGQWEHRGDSVEDVWTEQGGDPYSALPDRLLAAAGVQGGACQSCGRFWPVHLPECPRGVEGRTK